METRSLADQITQAKPSDRVGLMRLHESLKSAREQLLDGNAEVAGRFDAAVVLTRLLSISSDPVSAQDLQVVADLILIPNPGDDPRSHSSEEPQAAAAESEGEHEEEKGESNPDDLPALKSELRLVCDMTLGDVLLQMNLIGLGQLESSLRTQLRTRERLGDILVKNRDVTKQQLSSALQYQVRMRSNFPGKGDGADHGIGSSGDQQRHRELVADCLMGEILLRRGTITQEQLDKAVRVQRATGLRIGEAFVDTGAATWADIDKALELQSKSQSHRRHL